VFEKHAPRSKRAVPEAVEITTFPLADALNMRDFIEPNRDVDAWLPKQPCFVSAASASMRVGHIVDMLVWTSQEAGQMVVTGVVTEMAHSPVHAANRPVHRRLVDLAGPSRSPDRRCRPLNRWSGLRAKRHTQRRSPRPPRPPRGCGQGLARRI
jgi:hypothetical protein